MPRKTVDLLELIEHANMMMMNSIVPKGKTIEECKQFRRGVACLLESALRQAKAYHGFAYNENVVKRDENGKCVDIKDDTQRIYAIHPKLRG